MSLSLYPTGCHHVGIRFHGNDLVEQPMERVRHGARSGADIEHSTADTQTQSGSKRLR